MVLTRTSLNLPLLQPFEGPKKISKENRHQSEEETASEGPGLASLAIRQNQMQDPSYRGHCPEMGAPSYRH